MYRLKIVTHVYIKLRVLDNLASFLYHSGINIHIYSVIVKNSPSRNTTSKTIVF